jgi:hypothetical protein
LERGFLVRGGDVFSRHGSRSDGALAVKRPIFVTDFVVDNRLGVPLDLHVFHDRATGRALLIVVLKGAPPPVPDMNKGILLR